VLWVGLTGGIGAGKSAVSRRLVHGGTALVDADRIAREVVEPGTPGLAAVVEAFGPEVLTADGGLDRDALGQRVFGDDDARTRLNGIVHPLIGERTFALAAEAERQGAEILVHDVPLLVEGRLGPSYHLVVVVEAPEGARLDRLVRLRGMREQDARARMAAQASDTDRRAVADVLLVNDGPLERLDTEVDALLAERLRPYADNVRARRPAPRGPRALVPADPAWAAAGERLAQRLRFLCGETAVRVAHVGSTAVPGLAAEDVVDLQVECPTRDDAERLADRLADGGFPRCGDVTGDPPRREIDPDPAQYWKRLHRNADPGRAVDVHVRVAGSTGARMALALRDLLRTDDRARADYERVRAEEEEKRRHTAGAPDDVHAWAPDDVDAGAPDGVDAGPPDAVDAWAGTEVLLPRLGRALERSPRDDV
jgi:dephospho-CoA kinase